MVAANDMGYYTSICHGTITSAMNEGDDIYSALRSALSAKISPLMNIIIWDPLCEGKVRLHFAHLQEGVVYQIETTREARQQGPGVAASGAYMKTQGHLKAICGYWGLGDAGDILPNDIAPRVGDALVAPSDWPAKFADEVRKLSGLTVRRREVAMRYLGAAMAAMAARREGSEGSSVVTSGDLKLAVKEMEKADAELFGGEEMMKAVEQAGEEDAGQGEYA